MKSSGIASSLIAFLLLASTPLLAQEGGIPKRFNPIEEGRVEMESERLIPYDGDWWPATRASNVALMENFSRMLMAKHGFDPRLGEIYKSTLYVGPGSHVAHQYVDTDTGWFGMCNGTAAACTQRRKPESMTKTIAQETFDFTGGNLEFLMARASYSSQAMFDGQRSNLKQLPLTEARKLLENGATESEWQRWLKLAYNMESEPTNYSKSDIERIAKRELDKFDDLKPHDLDAILRTALGGAKIPFVLDVTADLQVWNYAAYKATLEAKAARNGKQLVEAEVVTRGGTENYEYELELDSSGRPIGGKYLNGSVNTHPDFAWVSTTPTWKLGEEIAKSIMKELNFEFKGSTLETSLRSPDGKAKITERVEKVVNNVFDDRFPLDYIRDSFVEDIEQATRFNTYGDTRYAAQRALEARLSGWGFGNFDLAGEVFDLLPADNRVVTDARGDLLTVVRGRPAIDTVDLSSSLLGGGMSRARNFVSGLVAPSSTSSRDRANTVVNEGAVSRINSAFSSVRTRTRTAP